MALRSLSKLYRVLKDFQFFSRRRRFAFSDCSAGVNQGLEFSEWISLVLTGACLSRIAVSSEL